MNFSPPVERENKVSASHGAYESPVDTHAAPQSWMLEQRTAQPLINTNQLISISAMISYISQCSGQSEFRVERRLSDRFNIPNVKCLGAQDFDNAICYLADLVQI